MSREAYTNDAATLYDEIYNKLPQSIKNRVKATILYRFGANKLEAEINHGDGPTLYPLHAALMCMFRPCAGVDQTLKDPFFAAREAFVKEANPSQRLDAGLETSARLVKTTATAIHMDSPKTNAKNMLTRTRTRLAASLNGMAVLGQR